MSSFLGGRQRWGCSGAQGHERRKLKQRSMLLAILQIAGKALGPAFVLFVVGLDCFFGLWNLYQSQNH